VAGEAALFVFGDQRDRAVIRCVERVEQAHDVASVVTESGIDNSADGDIVCGILPSENQRGSASRAVLASGSPYCRC